MAIETSEIKHERRGAAVVETTKETNERTKRTYGKKRIATRKLDGDLR